MALTLLAFDTPNARKISVALEEMGLPYAVQVVDITQNEQFDPDFLRISPNNKIPAIVDSDGPDSQPISSFESGAILLYLASNWRKRRADSRCGGLETLPITREIERSMSIAG